MEASPARAGSPGASHERRRFVDRGRRTVAATVAAGLVGTVLISVLPIFKLAYRSDAAHIAIETAAFIVPALAALLFAGRAVRGGTWTDLLLGASLALLSATNLCFSIVPAVIEQEPGPFSTWAPVAGRLLGAAGFAVAALMPARRLAQPRSAVWRTFAAVGVGVVLIALLTAALGDNLPRGVDPQLSPESATRPRIVGHVVVLGVQLAGLLLYAAAAVGFLRRAERSRDGLLLWVALAASLSGLARLNYFLFPSLYSEWLYVGDFLRLAAYIALLVGLSRELLAYQRQAADAAVFRERRRLARELHDGLAQELAFIRSQAERLAGTAEADRIVARVASAAERALEEARIAISALTTPLDEPLEASLVRAAEAVAERMGARVESRSAGTPQLTQEMRQSLERVVREAASNAVRHGKARLLRIEIDARSRLRVTVVDDGQGFDPNAARSRDSFGLISMRERIEAMDGQLLVRSSPGEGTTVEVTLP